MFSTIFTRSHATGVGVIIAVTLSSAAAGCTTRGRVVGEIAASAAPTTGAAGQVLVPMDFVYTGGPETAGCTADYQDAGAFDPAGGGHPFFPDLVECLLTHAGRPKAVASGATYSSPDGAIRIRTQAWLVTADQQAAHRNALFDHGADRCGFAVVAHEPEIFGEVDLRPVPVPQGAINAASYEARFTANGTTGPVYVDVVFLGDDRVESMAYVLSELRPADDLVTAATAQLAARLDMH